MRREAVLSSKIEGTQTSFSDLLFFEAASHEPPTAPDAPEVARYVRALEVGLEKMHELPLSLRLCRDVHECLMRGNPSATPGEFRTTQNWIGAPGAVLNEAQYVPPPVEEMHGCLRGWERFLHERPATLSVLVQAALSTITSRPSTLSSTEMVA